MWATMSGCPAHHCVSAEVHSRARRSSNTLWQNAIVLQYTSPVTIGDSSPAVTATIVSSSSRRPVSRSPCRISAWPCSCTTSATRSASPKRRPIAAASAATAPAAASSPPPAWRSTTGISR